MKTYKDWLLAAGLGAFLLLVSCLVAEAQGRESREGGGITGPPPGQIGGSTSTTAPSRIMVTYTFQGSPTAQANPSTQGVGYGFYKKASSNQSEITGAAPVIMTAQTPGLNIEMQDPAGYETLMERSLASALRNGEYRVAFRITHNISAPMTADSGVLQITVGDTSFVGFNRKLNGFGVLFGSSGVSSGPGNGIPANFKIDQWIGFVGDGNDTTYIPLGAETSNASENWFIYAAPNGGAVTFYRDGVLKGTISDVTRAATNDSGGWSGLAISATGGGNGQPEENIGPIAIERDF